MPHLPRACWPALLLLLAAATAPAHAAEEDVQFWLAETVSFAASPADSVTIDSSQRARSDKESGGEQFLARITLDHRLAPGVQLGGGMAYLEGENDQEVRFHQQLTLSHSIWQSRTRLEQRFFEDGDGPTFRLRERVQATLPLDRAKRWMLVGAVEGFFHLNRTAGNDETGLVALRHQAGLRHRLGPSLDIQLLYMQQRSFRDDAPDRVSHIPWATLSWRL